MKKGRSNSTTQQKPAPPKTPSHKRQKSAPAVTSTKKPAPKKATTPSKPKAPEKPKTAEPKPPKPQNPEPKTKPAPPRSPSPPSSSQPPANHSMGFADATPSDSRSHTRSVSPRGGEYHPGHRAGIKEAKPGNNVNKYFMFSNTHNLHDELAKPLEINPVNPAHRKADAAKGAAVGTSVRAAGRVNYGGETVSPSES